MTTATRSPSSCGATSPRCVRACAGSRPATTRSPTTWRRRPSSWRGATSSRFARKPASRPGSTGSRPIAGSPTRASARKCCSATATTPSADEDEDAAAPSAGVPDHARGTALKVDMERALDVLSEAERAAIVQCYHNDLSHEEAAFVLGHAGRHRQDARASREAEAQGRVGVLGAGRLNDEPDPHARRRLARASRCAATPARHRAGHIDDGGFTARVMAALPAPLAAPRWRKPVEWALWGVAGTAIAASLPGLATDVAREMFRLHRRRSRSRCRTSPPRWSRSVPRRWAARRTCCGATSAVRRASARRADRSGFSPTKRVSG